MTPLGIAFMKGHTGLADMILKQPGVDINFRDDQGTNESNCLLFQMFMYILSIILTHSNENPTIRLVSPGCELTTSCI